MIKVTPELISVNYTPGREGAYPVDAIVIHVTQGSAASVRSWFNDPSANASTHYMVTRAGGIVQFVREQDKAWGNGRKNRPTSALVLERINTNPNDWTISIEHEGTGKEELTDIQRIASVWLIRDIARRNPRIGLNRRQILRHQEIFSLKTCPGKISVDRLVQEALAAGPLCP